eukprot:snap_masked-scaffold_3-processed-gene-11.29-mRNA-1 protein AED:1.00 eAED:1.00 QI:0/-1/0/0/-1/1/1/0/1061
MKQKQRDKNKKTIDKDIEISITKWFTNLFLSLRKTVQSGEDMLNSLEQKYLIFAEGRKGIKGMNLTGFCSFMVAINEGQEVNIEYCKILASYLDKRISLKDIWSLFAYPLQFLICLGYILCLKFKEEVKKECIDIKNFMKNISKLKEYKLTNIEMRLIFNKILCFKQNHHSQEITIEEVDKFLKYYGERVGRKLFISKVYICYDNVPFTQYIGRDASYEVAIYISYSKQVKEAITNIKLSNGKKSKDMLRQGYRKAGEAIKLKNSYFTQKKQLFIRNNESDSPYIDIFLLDSSLKGSPCQFSQSIGCGKKNTLNLWVLRESDGKKACSLPIKKILSQENFKQIKFFLVVPEEDVMSMSDEDLVYNLQKQYRQKCIDINCIEDLQTILGSEKSSREKAWILGFNLLELSPIEVNIVMTKIENKDESFFDFCPLRVGKLFFRIYAQLLQLFPEKAHGTNTIYIKDPAEHCKMVLNESGGKNIENNFKSLGISLSRDDKKMLMLFKNKNKELFIEKLLDKIKYILFLVQEEYYGKTTGFEYIHSIVEQRNRYIKLDFTSADSHSRQFLDGAKQMMRFDNRGKFNNSIFPLSIVEISFFNKYLEPLTAGELLPFDSTQNNNIPEQVLYSNEKSKRLNLTCELNNVKLWVSQHERIGIDIISRLQKKEYMGDNKITRIEAFGKLLRIFEGLQKEDIVTLKYFVYNFRAGRGGEQDLDIFPWEQLVKAISEIFPMESASETLFIVREMLKIYRQHFKVENMESEFLTSFALRKKIDIITEHFGVTLSTKEIQEFFDHFLKHTDMNRSNCGSTVDSDKFSGFMKLTAEEKLVQDYKLFHKATGTEILFSKFVCMRQLLKPYGSPLTRRTIFQKLSCRENRNKYNNSEISAFCDMFSCLMPPINLNCVLSGETNSATVSPRKEIALLRKITQPNRISEIKIFPSHQRTRQKPIVINSISTCRGSSLVTERNSIQQRYKKGKSETNNWCCSVCYHKQPVRVQNVCSMCLFKEYIPPEVEYNKRTSLEFSSVSEVSTERIEEQDNNKQIVIQTPADTTEEKDIAWFLNKYS